MPVFFHEGDNNQILITNFKVMYTSLLRQESLKKSTFGSQLMKLALLNKFGVYKKNFYLLVRNPYSRTESFFKDKFRKSAKFNEEKNKWQHSQTIFFKHLGINDSMSNQEIRERLLNTSFDEFLDILPHVYTLDRHLQPQFFRTKMLFRKGPLKLPFKIKFSRVFKIECPEDIKDLTSIFNLNLSQRFNNTKQIDNEITWSVQNQNVVKKIYQQDFIKFNYSLDLENKKSCS